MDSTKEGILELGLQMAMGHHVGARSQSNKSHEPLCWLLVSVLLAEFPIAWIYPIYSADVLLRACELFPVWNHFMYVCFLIQ